MRHRVKSRKLHRDVDARRALIYALTKNVLENEAIKTSSAKAKYIKGIVEKLVTTAKAEKDALAKRRLLLSKLRNNKVLVDLAMEKAKVYAAVSSGFLRIQKLENKKGDNSEYVKLSWVDVAKKEEAVKAEDTASESKTTKPKTVKKAVVKKVKSKTTEEKPVKKVAKKAESK